MEREEFKKIIKGMKSVFSDPKFIADQFAFDMWYGLLGDLPYEVVSMATKAYMQSETFAPSPADIRRYAYKVTSPVTEDMSELEAWGLVRKAINNGIYGADEEFAKLPPLIQRTLGNPARIREMATLDSKELETVDASNFMRSYRARLEAQKRYGQLDTYLQIQIEQKRQNNTPSLAVRETEQKGIEFHEKEETGFSPEIAEMLEAYHKTVSDAI